MGLRRKPEKGNWKETACQEYPGYIVDTEKLAFGITPQRLEKMKGIAASLQSQTQSNRQLVDQSLLRHFCGVAISTFLAMSLAQF